MAFLSTLLYKVKRGLFIVFPLIRAGYLVHDRSVVGLQSLLTNKKEAFLVKANSKNWYMGINMVIWSVSVVYAFSSRGGKSSL